MEDTNVISLEELFNAAKKSNDEDKYRELFEKLRWGNEPYCPHCGCMNKIYRYKNNKLFKCADCRKQFSITVGTAFEYTHLSFTQLFKAIYYFFHSKKSISSHHLARILEVQQKTAWYLLHKIRYSVSKEEKLMDKFYGLIQVDETFVGGKNKNRHLEKQRQFRKGKESLTKAIVVGMLEKNRRKIKLFVVRDRGSGILHSLIRTHVKRESHIVSDDWVGYQGLDFSYWRTVINHRTGKYMNGAFSTNAIEGFWSTFKKAIIGTHHSVSKKYLQTYCDEHVFRYNNHKLSILEIMGKVIQCSQNRQMRRYEYGFKLGA